MQGTVGNLCFYISVTPRSLCSATKYKLLIIVMDSILVAKRFACDRCREHKLRCLRNEDDNRVCERCIRAGALCVTSSGLPLGRRPPSQSYATRGSLNSNTQSFYQQQCSRATRKRPTQSNGFHPPPLDITFSCVNEPNSTAVLCPDSTFDTMSGPSIANTEFSSDLQPSSQGSALGTPVSIVTQPAWLWTEGPSNVVGPDFGSIDEEQTTNNHNGGSINAEAREDVDDFQYHSHSMLGLVGVTSSLSRQLAELRARPWDPSFMRISWLGGHEADAFGPMQPNPLEKTLCVTMTFVSVLQMIAPMDCPSPPPRLSPTSLSTTLMALSTYLLLIQLFDNILTRIGDCIPNMAVEKNLDSLQELLGSPFQSWRLHITVSIRLFKQQLNTFERLLGLPAEYRLWSRNDSYPGILGYQDSSKLLQAAMGKPQDDTHGLWMHQTRALTKTIEQVEGCLRS